MFVLFCLPYSCFLSYFTRSVPMCKCLGEHSCMSSPFSIAILIELSPEVEWECVKLNSVVTAVSSRRNFLVTLE